MRQSKASKEQNRKKDLGIECLDLCLSRYFHCCIFLVFFILHFLTIYVYICSQSDTPGPGFYETEANEYVKSGPSISKKGFSNAFLSKSYRLKSVIRNDILVGPGDYDFNPYNRLNDMTKDRISFIQADNGKGRVPFPEPLPHPGVGDYHLEIEPGHFSRLKRLNSATFKSQSGRDSYLVVSK